MGGVGRAKRVLAASAAAVVAAAACAAAVSSAATRSGQAASPELRPPVTLVPVDGGQAYYTAWKNGPPGSAAWFPVGVWLDTLSEEAAPAAYRALGVNTYLGVAGGPPTPAQIVRARDARQVVIGAPMAPRPGFDAGKTLAGHFLVDEPDMRADCAADRVPLIRRYCEGGREYLPAADLRRLADAVRAADRTRPVVANFGKGLAVGPRPGRGDTPWGKWWYGDGERRAYVDAVDIVSFDYYPVSDDAHPGTARDLGLAVERVRAFAAYRKPVWVILETTCIRDDPGRTGSRRCVTPAGIEAQVWQALVHGARGIVYFNHDFSSGRETHRVLLDPRWPAVQKRVAEINGRIARLAPDLNAPSVPGALEARADGAGVDALLKWRDGGYTLLAVPRGGSTQHVAFTVRGVDEAVAVPLLGGSAVPVRDGRFCSTFPDGLTPRAFRIVAAGRVPALPASSGQRCPKATRD